jgi:hypothetical protein
MNLSFGTGKAVEINEGVKVIRTARPLLAPDTEISVVPQSEEQSRGPSDLATALQICLVFLQCSLRRWRGKRRI